MFALAGAAIIVVAVGGIAYAKTRAPNYQSAIVGRGDIADEVLASGNVESPGAATLHFKTTGKLAALNVSAGDAVEAGEVLASLDTGTLQAAYDEAAANLAAAKSALSKLQAGATDEDVAVVSAAKESADVSASNAADTLANADTAALQNLRSALSSKVDQLFTDPETNPGFGITISSGNTRYLIKAGDTAEQSLINRLRRQVGDELYALSASINEEEDLGMRSQKAQAAADDTATLLSHIADAMGDYTGTDTDGQAVYQGYKADIASARTSVESTRSALIGAISAYESASASVAQAQKMSRRPRPRSMRRMRALLRRARRSPTRRYLRRHQASWHIRTAP
jgi:multidrug efflux pump subunit AcrA (membrane-fusion protein)